MATLVLVDEEVRRAGASLGTPLAGNRAPGEAAALLYCEAVRTGLSEGRKGLFC